MYAKYDTRGSTKLQRKVAKTIPKDLRKGIRAVVKEHAAERIAEEKKRMLAAGNFAPTTETTNKLAGNSTTYVGVTGGLMKSVYAKVTFKKNSLGVWYGAYAIRYRGREKTLAVDDGRRGGKRGVSHSALMLQRKTKKKEAIAWKGFMVRSISRDKVAGILRAGNRNQKVFGKSYGRATPARPYFLEKTLLEKMSRRMMRFHLSGALKGRRLGRALRTFAADIKEITMAAGEAA